MISKIEYGDIKTTDPLSIQKIEGARAALNIQPKTVMIRAPLIFRVLLLFVVVMEFVNLF